MPPRFVFRGTLGSRLFIRRAYGRDVHPFRPNILFRLLVSEFLFWRFSGRVLNSRHAQRITEYEYSTGARLSGALAFNVMAQAGGRGRMVVNGSSQLLGSNPCERGILLPLIAEARAPPHHVMVPQTQHRLPFMNGTALVDPGRFDFLIDDQRYAYDLFGPQITPSARSTTPSE